MASDFFLKFDDFHKFESFEDTAEQAAHDLRRLGHDSVDLGFGFLKLIRDGSVPSDSPAAVTVDLKFKHDDAIIGDDFFKLGSAFVSAADAQHKVDIKEIVIVKKIDVASPILFSETSDGGGGADKVAADLASYEADLKFTGNDFLKIAPQIAADTPSESLSLNFSNISLDYKAQNADLLKISEDFKVLAASASDFKIRGLSDAFLKYSDDALKLAADYLKVGADFQQISQDFTSKPGNDSAAGLKFNQGVLQNSDDFIKLAGDLKFLNADYKVLAGDTLKLSDTLESAAHQLPAVQKT